MRGALAYLKGSMIALLCRPDLTVRTVAIQLGNINLRGELDSEVAGTKWQHSTVKGKVGVDNIMDSGIKATIRMSDSYRPMALAS